MKWKAEGLAEPYSRRKIVKFALLPTRVKDHWIWLEKYWQHQFFGPIGNYWVNDYKTLIE